VSPGARMMRVLGYLVSKSVARSPMESSTLGDPLSGATRGRAKSA